MNGKSDPTSEPVGAMVASSTGPTSLFLAGDGGVEFRQRDLPAGEGGRGEPGARTIRYSARVRRRLAMTVWLIGGTFQITAAPGSFYGRKRNARHLGPCREPVDSGS